MLIYGRCHCGNITFQLTWRPAPTEIPARACGCSFCVKHGGVWTSCPAGSLLVQTEDASRVQPYRFGTGTAQFHLCTTCGVVPVVTSTIAKQVYGVVNVNAFEGVDARLLNRASTSFDGEDEASRLARRAKNWIADVQFGIRP
jgi:hypothetical protein